MKFVIFKKHLPSSLTKGKDNFNLLVGNQRASCNKVSIGYELKNISKIFSDICNAKSASQFKTLKCNYS